MFVIHVLAGIRLFIVVLDGIGIGVSVGVFVVVIGIVLALVMVHLLV